MPIGDRIRLGRQIAGMTPEALAARADLSLKAIEHYETGRATPGSQHLIRLAEALGVGVEFFMRPVTVTSLERAR